MASFHTCPWPSRPPGSAPSYQERVPDNALLQSPRVHDAERRKREGLATQSLLRCVHSPQHLPGMPPAQVRVPDDADTP